MEKKTGFNFKRIVINAVVLFAFLIGLSYAAVVITNNDIQKNGVSAMFQGGTWTASQNLNGQNATNGSYYTLNGTKITTSFTDVICNVYDTGCSIICNGDCTQKIQQSINGANKRVLIRQGTYQLSGSLNLSGNTLLIGDGIDQTILNLSVNSNCKMIQNIHQTSNVAEDSNIEIADMTLNGNGLLQDGTNSWYGIWLGNANNLYIHRVKILNPAGYCIGYNEQGVDSNIVHHSIISDNICIRNSTSLQLADAFATGMDDGHINRNYILNLKGAGITMSHGFNMDISYNTINSSDVALNLEGQSSQEYITFSNNKNYVNGNTGGGVIMGSYPTRVLRHISVKDNYFEVATGYAFESGYYGLATYGLEFSENVVNKTGSGPVLIYLANMSNVKINNNKIYTQSDFSSHIIQVESLNDSEIIGNTVNNAPASFLNILYSSKNVKIERNTIANAVYSFILGTAVKTYFTIKDNSIYNSGFGGEPYWGYGIRCSYCFNSVISDNFIINSSQNAIYVTTDSANNTIEDNVVFGYNSSLTSMYIAGTNYADDYQYTTPITSLYCSDNSVFNEKWVSNSTGYYCKCSSDIWTCIAGGGFTGSCASTTTISVINGVITGCA